MINQLPPSNEAFESLSGSFFNYAFNGIIGGKGGGKAKRIAFLLSIVVVTYAGVEAIKLIFRSDFGKKGIDIWKLLLSLGAFITIGVIAFNNYSSFEEYEYLAQYGTKNTFLYTSIFYFVLTLFLLVKGWIEIRKKATNPVHPSYRGSSTVLGFLSQSGWTQAKIQNLAEPLLVFAIGVFLTPINWYLGIPLIFSAISVWLHFAYEAIRGFLNARNELSNSEGKAGDFERASRVIN